jgi:hypothetical protein
MHKKKKKIKKLLNPNGKTPDLSKYNDFSEYIEGKKELGYMSESDADDIPEAKVDFE